LKKGFNKLIPDGKINTFTTEEFDALMCGNQHIDVREWKKSTQY